jgi:DNA polymerase (family X)
MRNGEIAEAFDELASLYELDGAVVYRVVAYRNAAKAIREAGVSVAELARQGRVEELAGVGKTIAEKIDALLETGSIPSADKLKQRIPAGLVEVTRIPGLGPKRAKLLHDQLGVSSIEDLRRSAESGQLKDVRGFGKKAEENVLAAFAAGADGTPKARMILSKALPVGEELVAALREHPAAIRVELAGSARRLADTVKDLDIVAASSDPAALSEAFTKLDAIDSVSTFGEAGAKTVTHSGLSVDLRIVPEEAFGNLLQHFTGSGRHNEALRTEAVRRGLHVSEYGIADDERGGSEAFATEEEVYERLGMQHIPPELRENRGELEAARAGRLPELIELGDIRGDLHMHTTLSDGHASVEEMASAARELGYEYIAITDHSASHGFGDDVQPDALLKRLEEIRSLPDLGITVLAGTETNVLPDGSLDYEDDVLEQLDWVIASLHTSFRLSEKNQTARMLSAMNHPLVDAIGHPTGRLLESREPYALDLDRVIAGAVESGTFLEINANPDRRDLNDVYARAAAEAGVTLLIDSDAHWPETLQNMRYGVATARRAWLTADNVGNTRPWTELDRMRKRSRNGR